MNKIIIFAIILVTIYASVFFIPQRVDKLALIPGKSMEVWRFVTYSFVHLNLRHLVENIVGLGLIAVIAFELNVAFSDFSSSYMASSLLSVIPIWLILSFTTLGASNAIFGGFGLISQETRKYKMNGLIIFIVLTALIFAGSISNFFSYGFGSEEFAFAIKQSLSHFSGLIFGIGFFFLLIKIKPMLTKKKRYVLRGEYR